MPNEGITTYLLAQGGLGVGLAISLWLLREEKKEHREDNKAKDAEIKELNLSLQATADRSIKVLEGLYEKIEPVKRGQI